MKKVLIALALISGLTSFAQGGGHNEHRIGGLKDLTPEQMATLKTKKMALALDLDKKQQKAVLEIHLEEAVFYQSRMEVRKAATESGETIRPSADERFALANEKLDRRLAVQQKLKQILDEGQYAQWKRISHRKHASSKWKRLHNHRSD